MTFARILNAFGCLTLRCDAISQRCFPTLWSISTNRTASGSLPSCTPNKSRVTGECGWVDRSSAEICTPHFLNPSSKSKFLSVV